MKLKTKLMLGVPSVLLIVMVVCTILVSLIVYKQQRAASNDSLDKSFKIIRQDITERQEKLAAAARQMATAQDLGIKVQFIQENTDEKNSADFSLFGSQYRSMFRSEYLTMAESIFEVASSSGVQEVRLYNLEGKFILGLQTNGDNVTIAFTHNAENQEMVEVKKGVNMANVEWTEVDAIDPDISRDWEGNAPAFAIEDFYTKGDRIGQFALVPVMGAVYSDELEDFEPRQFGFLTAVKYFEQQFVERSAKISDANVNLFLPGGLSRGTLPAQQQCDFTPFKKVYDNWSLMAQDPIHSEVKIGGKNYFQASLPLYAQSQCIGALVSLTPMDLARSNTWQVTWVLIVIFLVCTGVMFPVSFFASRSIFSHVQEVVDNLRDIAEGDGDLTVRLNVESKDEIGDLARSFNVFIEKIHVIVSRIKESADALATSSSQISATSSQLSTSSMETSTTVLELSTTAEEVKQTTTVANEKAEAVAREAEATAQISEAGRKATDEAVEGMQRIKEEMEYIAESIVKLSEHTHSIGEIIDTVADLANESNLLSVNASIEAAKAGEFGKGFGVVAQEVKSLADLSKQATSQVRTILNDIQTATSASVLATERGSKAVDTGEALASRSGESIRALESSVLQASNSATQIAASSQQQLVGIAQLSDALDSITEASKQNSEGAKQLESATVQLHNLGQELKELAGRFRL
ncbi:Methyl-accepting chemotaxis protein [Desulfatibacillum alkenivorans DSM 16219]|jgi:methyl-accepting chemotaxis protein|uniref:Methyl-accepting chemotaxis protein n=1 Tax=Desulfatibacillum alkenivorans DSM 16219 TaxID=1121393 RepID=A0A1M6E554_9BACT|nr:methyl-accepting chemotaxis protein [Desulfatibacillum alkenivorans]SHI80627.1 Methyl-accepting chemotaxis protein [Desulfatibacillum alkenivorans DSM 16219]